MPKKKSKPARRTTYYAYQDRTTGKWYDEFGTYRATEARAQLTPTRHDVDERKIRVISGRFVPLSTRTKASPKRTR